MKRIGTIFNILGIIGSAIGLVVSLFFTIYNRVNNGEFLSLELYINLYGSAFWLVPILVLSIIGLKNGTKGIYIAGIVVCFISAYSTYGVSLIALVGFVFQLIFLNDIEKEKEERIEALPEQERVYIQNNDINYRYKHVDYKEYVNKRKAYYIVSCIISATYILAFLFGVYKLTSYIYDAWGIDHAGLAIVGIIILSIFYFGFLFLVFLYILAGFVVSILALTSPSRRVLKVNRVLGFICLTIFNGIASMDILDEIDKNIKIH